MNKDRLNQILETLLFPFTDPEQGRHDSLFLSYKMYYEAKNTKIRQGSVYQKNNRDYKKEKQKLIEYLTEKNHWRVKNEDDVEKMCDFFYPMKSIEYYLEKVREISSSKAQTQDMAGYYIHRMIPMIARSLLTYRDGVAAIRPWVEVTKENNDGDIFSNSSVFNKIEIWNLLCRICNPDIFIAAAAVDSNLGLEALYEQRSAIALADKLLVKNLQNGLAENHLHFNVGYDYDVLWMYCMNLELVEKEYELEEKHALLKCALFRYIAALYLENQENCHEFELWMEEKCSKNLRNCIRKLGRGDYKEKIDKCTLEEISEMYHRMRIHGMRYSSDYLLESVYLPYLEYKTTSEFIFLYQSYKYIKAVPEDAFFSNLFLQYLRLKNDYYARTHETHLLQGFKFFQKKYDTASSQLSKLVPERERMIEILRSQSKIRYLKKLEIRITPNVELVEIEPFDYKLSRRVILERLYMQLFEIFNAYRQFVLESAIGVRNTREFLYREKVGLSNDINLRNMQLDKNFTSLHIPNVGIVFHLLKRKYLEDESRQYCWRTVEKGAASNFLYRLCRRYYARNIALAIEEIRQAIPHMDQYIVGLDAASDENSEEPWIYAMAYQKVRSHESTRPVVKRGNYQGEYDRIQNMGFTYHVGEDFRHIISGLRHIDEVIEEFGYKPGDRLGHATVLGIDIRQWIQENEIVMLPVQEYMENLLWMWGLGISDYVDLGIELEKLEDKIIECANEIYGCPESLKVRHLYQAYKEKFSASHMEIAAKQKKGEVDNNKCCHNACDGTGCRKQDEEKQLQSTCHKECEEHICRGWTKEKLLLTNYCPCFVEGYSKIKVLNVSMNEMETFQRIQNHLIRKIEKKGIYVETNPTSNLTIGDFSRLSDHPIFFLNQDRKGGENHVMVTVNSDDPAVFGTNVENELAYIYYAAEAQGYSKEELLSWIDKIRAHGMNASFIQVDKSPDVILAEVEEIINKIRKKINEGVD